jgi:hypothetical protein
LVEARSFRQRIDASAAPIAGKNRVLGDAIANATPAAIPS